MKEHALHPLTHALHPRTHALTHETHALRSWLDTDTSPSPN
jgi:hypothetical protein